MSQHPPVRMMAGPVAADRHAAQLQARFPHCTRACEAGRSQCNCPPQPAEACTDMGAEPAPLQRGMAAYMLAPLIERWPRLAGWLTFFAVLGLLILGGEQPINVHPLGADYLPSDGVPPQLLTALPEPAASEVQP